MSLYKYVINSFKKKFLKKNQEKRIKKGKTVILYKENVKKNSK